MAVNSCQKIRIVAKITEPNLKIANTVSKIDELHTEFHAMIEGSEA